jgi:hypothetical protein
MKKYLFILMLFPFIGYGQSEKAWIQSYPNQDTIYYGYPNVIKYEAHGCKSKNYITCSDGGTLVLSGSEYQVRVRPGVKELTVKLWCDTNKEYPIAEKTLAVTYMSLESGKRIKSHQQGKKP